LSLSNKEIKAKIMSRVGKPVKFKFPGGEVREGRLLDRAVVMSIRHPDASYWDVIDLIQFPVHANRKWIRISYYRQVGDRLGWAGQTSITEPPHVWKRIFAQGAKEKSWFRDVLVRALDEHE
jgi:hypothetical protein